MFGTVAMATKLLLSAGEWEALLFQTPAQVRPLLLRLAVHHKFMKEATVCPNCGRKKGEANNAVEARQ